MSTTIVKNYNTVIHLPYGELSNIIEWCKRNCTGSWQFEEGEPESQSMVFSNGFKEVMRLDSSGSLGIGTTSPSNWNIQNVSKNPYTFYFEDERDYIAFIMWKK